MRSIPHALALRSSCHWLSSNDRYSTRSPASTPATMNCSPISVLPVPVAPVIIISASRYIPPPHIASSSALPSEIRSAEPAASPSIGENGTISMPDFALITNGNSPL